MNKTIYKYTKFDNVMKIFRFIQIIKYFKKLESVLIHIPEYMTESFYLNDIKIIKDWLKKIKDIHINILNQNVELMPDIDVINNLKYFCNKLTNTTAHESYSNKKYRNKFGIPLHHLSARVSFDDYIYKKYICKENIILISPDKNKHKRKILDKIKNELTGF